MSEYQYYEFQAIDRPLTVDEQNEVSSWSSRTQATATQAVFVYNYGDFQKSPQDVIEKYFDAMLYLTNWGTKQLIFRFPNSVINADAIMPYCHPDAITVTERKDCLILEIVYSPEEGSGDWVEGDGWLPSLIPLRDDIINGDFRMVYLAWLQAIANEYDTDLYKDNLEPPVPENLQDLSGVLECFIEFFEIDNHLISIAAENSNTVAEMSPFEIEKALLKLTENERNQYLIDLATGKKRVRSQLIKRLCDLNATSDKQIPEPERRRISDLLAKINYG